MELIYGAPLWLAQTNFWVVRSTKSSNECVLIDVPPQPDIILDFLTQNSLKPVAIIATHGHIDHTGGIPTIVEAKETLDENGNQTIPVHIHKNDMNYLSDPVGSSPMLGEALKQAKISNRLPELIEFIDSDATFEGAGMRFTALHTPGHTPGSTCFKLQIADLDPVLFTGDHLFAGSIGRTDLDGGSYPALLDSMATKIWPLPDKTVVLPGHGASTTIGVEKATNPYLVDIR